MKRPKAPIHSEIKRKKFQVLCIYRHYYYDQGPYLVAIIHLVSANNCYYLTIFFIPKGKSE